MFPLSVSDIHCPLPVLDPEELGVTFGSVGQGVEGPTA